MVRLMAGKTADGQPAQDHHEKKKHKDPEEYLWAVQKREKYTKVVSARDLENFGYGLDRYHTYFIILCYIAFTGVMIWYIKFLADKVNRSARMMAPVTTTVDVASNGEFFDVPVPAITVCLAVAPQTAFLEFPNPESRIGFYPSGISGQQAANLTSDAAQSITSNTGTFFKGPPVPSDNRLGGQPYLSAYYVPLSGPNTTGTIEMIKDGLVRVRLFVSRDVSVTPQNVFNLPPQAAMVYLSDPKSEPDWLVSAKNSTELDRCRDISYPNVTAIEPDGVYLFRYQQRQLFKDNGDHENPADLVGTVYEYMQVSRLDSSKVSTVSDIDTTSLWQGYMHNLNQSDPQYFESFINSTSRCGAKDNSNCVSLLDLYFQYDGEMQVERYSLEQVYGTSQAVSDAMAILSMGVQSIATAGLVLFIIVRLRMMYVEKQAARTAAQRGGPPKETA